MKTLSADVVVVGGGYGGATVAKYLRMWSDLGVDVTLVERNPQFISCPISNLVIGGDKTMADITMGYDGLRNTWGVKLLQDTVVSLDAGARKLTLASGGVLGYDRLVLSPGIEFMGEKTWTPGKNLQKFIAATFGIQPKEQQHMVQAISDAVADVGPQVRQAMTQHPGFEDIGKRMLLAWAEGVQGLRDERVYAVGAWQAGDAFEGFSPPTKTKNRNYQDGALHIAG